MPEVTLGSLPERDHHHYSMQLELHMGSYHLLMGSRHRHVHLVAIRILVLFAYVVLDWTFGQVVLLWVWGLCNCSASGAYVALVDKQI